MSKSLAWLKMVSVSLGLADLVLETESVKIRNQRDCNVHMKTHYGGELFFDE